MLRKLAKAGIVRLQFGPNFWLFTTRELVDLVGIELEAFSRRERAGGPGNPAFGLLGGEREPAAEILSEAHEAPAFMRD